MEKKYQIFISSTYIDLKEPRVKVRDAILTMMHFPVGMEMFNAADEEQWEIIQETIDSSDYYVLILGQRYGPEIEEGAYAGISYTEREFRYAVEKQIPILAFLIDDSVPINKAFIEDDAKRIKLEAFKAEVQRRHMVQWWENADELARKVSESLHKQMDRKKRVGWIRGDSFDIEASHAELLELNKRIRELEKENEKLKSQIVERKPELSISFVLDEVKEKKQGYEVENECRSHGKLVQENDANGIKLKMVDGNVEGYKYKYEPLNVTFIDPVLKRFITREDIEKYNDSLPEQKEVDTYIKKMKLYETIRKSGVTFYIDVLNNGTAKATDVRIHVEMPDGIRLMHLEGVKDLKEPQAPALPPNPIEEAERKYERSISPMTDWMRSSIVAQSVWPLENLPTIDSFICKPSGMPLTQSFSIDENSLLAECRQIPHKDSKAFDSFYLVPLKRCKGKIKISLMCSEYIEPEVQYVDFEVT